jgi:hypothetical protein
LNTTTHEANRDCTSQHLCSTNKIRIYRNNRYLSFSNFLLINKKIVKKC